MSGAVGATLRRLGIVDGRAAAQMVEVGDAVAILFSAAWAAW